MSPVSKLVVSRESQKPTQSDHALAGETERGRSFKSYLIVRCSVMEPGETFVTPTAVRRTS